MGSSGTRVNQAEFNFKQDPESASIILDMFQGATVIPASIMYDSGDISKVIIMNVNYIYICIMK